MMRTVALLAATVTTGIVAGLFYSFSVSVMPGLHRSADRTFIDVMQRINTAILNGWFALCFGGALVSTAVATAVNAGGGRGAVLLPAAAGLVLYLAVLTITAVVHIPLNNLLLNAGPPDRIGDPVAVRRVFEARWVRWNVARTVVSCAAFGCLCWALVQHGRAGG